MVASKNFCEIGKSESAIPHGFEPESTLVLVSSSSTNSSMGFGAALFAAFSKLALHLARRRLSWSAAFQSKHACKNMRTLYSSLPSYPLRGSEAFNRSHLSLTN